jgi:hypothetical protein
MAAVSFMAETNVVARPEPFQLTMEDEMKPLPFTVSVKPLSPTVALVAESEEMDGIGFDGVGEAPPAPPHPLRLSNPPRTQLNTTNSRFRAFMV